MKKVGQATERRNRSGRPAAIATLGIGAILVTPYCGLLFGCGCSWPWSGLAAQCSFFQPESTIVCPWCEHALAGIASVLLSAVAGALIAAKIGLNTSLSRRSAIVVRILIGTAVFLLVGTAAGWATATATDYPKFLFASDSGPHAWTDAHNRHHNMESARRESLWHIGSNGV